MNSVLAGKRLDYAAAVIVRARRGKLSFLVMKTVKRSGPHEGVELWQFIGGMEELVDQGNPFRTLAEEITEESGFYLRPGYRDPELIRSVKKYDNHQQRFYLIWREGLRGQLRSDVIVDGDKILGVPEWKSVDFLKRRLCDSHSVVLPELVELDHRYKGLK